MPDFDDQDKKWPWVPLLVVLIVVGVIVWRLTAAGWINISLPDKSVPLPSPIVETSKLTCPVSGFCDQLKEIIQDGASLGYGSDKVASEAAILASMDGTLTTGKMTTASNEEFAVLSILNSQQQKQAFYWFKGTHVDPGEIKKGEVIGISSGQAISGVQNQQLIFNVIDSASGDMFKLTSSDFE